MTTDTTSRARLVLVTGGTGAVGQAVVERLRREGCRVRVLSRGVTPSPWLPGDVELVRGDVVDPGAVAEAVRGASWVFHLASHVPPRASVLDEAACARVNVGGTRVVAEASALAGVRRLVFFSTIAVYGPTPGAEADEQSLPRPGSTPAETKQHAEQAVRAADGRGALRTTILRVAAVYGPRAKGHTMRLLRALDAGWFVPIGPGLNRRTLIHEADLAEAALLAARSPRAAGGLFNVSDGEVHRLRDVIEAQCLALGRGVPRFRIPLGFARLAARVGDRALSAFAGPLRLAPLLEKYTEDVAVRADLIRRELGFRARLDLRSGWSETVRAGR